MGLKYLYSLLGIGFIKEELVFEFNLLVVIAK